MEWTIESRDSVIAGVIQLGRPVRFGIRFLISLTSICAIAIACSLYPIRPAKIVIGQSKTNTISELDRLDAVDRGTLPNLAPFFAGHEPPSDEEKRIEEEREFDIFGTEEQRYWHLPHQQVMIETVFKNDKLAALLIWKGQRTIPIQSLRASVKNENYDTN